MKKLSIIIFACILLLFTNSKANDEDNVYNMDFNYYFYIEIRDNDRPGKWSLYTGIDSACEDIINDLRNIKFIKSNGRIIDYRDYKRYIRIGLPYLEELVITDTGICYFTDYLGEKWANPKLQNIVACAKNTDDCKEFFDTLHLKYKLQSRIFDNEDINTKITRAEFVSLMAYYSELLVDYNGDVNYESDPFYDCHDFGLHGGDIWKYYDKNIIKGKAVINDEKCYFGAKEAITNEEEYTLLSRFLKSFNDIIEWDEELYSYTLPKDFDKVSDWAQDDIKYLLKRNLIDLSENKYLNPSECVTYAKAIESSDRIYQYLSRIINQDMFVNGTVNEYEEYGIYNWHNYEYEYTYKKVPILKIFDKN